MDKRNIITNNKEVEIQVDFGNGNIQNVIFDKEKYEGISFLNKFINAVYQDLISDNFPTNNKFTSHLDRYMGVVLDLIEEDVLPYNKNLVDLTGSLADLANDKRFQSNEQRFLDLKRTDDDHKKKFKIKYKDGFMSVASGYKFGGLSQPIPVIKRILSPGKSFNKYRNTWIEKKDKMSPTTEIYKARVLELLDVSKNKIRLQSTNWKVEYIKMNEDAHILTDAIKDRDFLINKKDLIKNVLISYLFFIGDRHHGNILDDMSHIDFGLEKSDKRQKGAYPKLESLTNKDFIKYLNDNDFKSIKSILFNYLYDASYRGDIYEQFKNIPQNEFEKYCHEALNEISQNLKDPKILEELHSINEDYKKDMRKDGDKQPSNLFFSTAIMELSQSNKRIR